MFGERNEEMLNYSQYRDSGDEYWPSEVTRANSEAPDPMVLGHEVELS